MLIIDDLVDTGKTAKRVGINSIKTAGELLVGVCVTEVGQESWIFFPWGSEGRFWNALEQRKKTVEKKGESW